MYGTSCRSVNCVRQPSDAKRGYFRGPGAFWTRNSARRSSMLSWTRFASVYADGNVPFMVERVPCMVTRVPFMVKTVLFMVT
eukprot:670669-Rhodomonas_salina.3